MGRRTLDCTGSEGRVSTTLCIPASIVANTYSPSELLPHFRQGVSSFCFCERLADEGCHRTGILRSWLLQSFICYSKGHGRLASSHQSFTTQLLCSPFSFSYGNLPVGPPFPAPRGLDDFHRPSGCVPPGSCPPGISVVPQVCLGHQTFQFRVLCFGLSSAPQVFTHVMAPISSIMHRFVYQILRYLDDWLVLGSSFQEITWARDFLLWLCRELGVQVNLAKSSLTLTQTLNYLGITLQSTPLRAFPTQARIRKVLSLVEEFSSSREQPLSLWRSLLGVMSSMSALVPGSRLRMSPLQLRLNVAGPKLSEDVLVSWDDSCLPDLRWWSVANHLKVGVSLDLPHPSLLLFTDTSDSGWGALSGDDRLSGLWSPVASRFSINH